MRWSREKTKCLKTDLIVKESLFHSVVGTDNLKNVPGKFLVELPCYEAHQNSDESDDTRNDDEGWSQPLENDVGANNVLHLSSLEQFIKRPLHLIDLDGCIHNERKVGKANSDNLNGVLGAQSIPDNNELVQETKDEQGQESRNRLHVCFDFLLHFGCQDAGKIGADL